MKYNISVTDSVESVKKKYDVTAAMDVCEHLTGQSPSHPPCTRPFSWVGYLFEMYSLLLLIYGL